MPLFLVGDLGELIDLNLFTVVAPPDTVGFCTKDEELTSIPRLSKDSLMPKDMSEEKVRVNSPERFSPRSSRSSGKKFTRFSRKSSSKLEDKLKSISLVDKNPNNAEKDLLVPFSKLGN